MSNILAINLIDLSKKTFNEFCVRYLHYQCYECGGLAHCLGSEVFMNGIDDIKGLKCEWFRPGKNCVPSCSEEAKKEKP